MGPPVPITEVLVMSENQEETPEIASPEEDPLSEHPEGTETNHTVDDEFTGAPVPETPADDSFSNPVVVMETEENRQSDNPGPRDTRDLEPACESVLEVPEGQPVVNTETEVGEQPSGPLSGENNNSEDETQSSVSETTTTSSTTSGPSVPEHPPLTATDLALQYELQPESVALVRLLAERVPSGKLTVDVLECLAACVQVSRQVSVASAENDTDVTECLEIDDAQVAESLERLNEVMETDDNGDSINPGEKLDYTTPDIADPANQDPVREEDPVQPEDEVQELSPRSALAEQIDQTLTLNQRVFGEASGQPAGPPGATLVTRTVYEGAKPPRIEQYWKMPKVQDAHMLPSGTNKRPATAWESSPRKSRDRHTTYHTREYRRSSGNRRLAEEQGRAAARREREESERRARDESRRRREAATREQKRREQEQANLSTRPPAQTRRTPDNPRIEANSREPRCYYCRGHHPSMTCHLGFRLRTLGREGMRRFEEEHPPRATNGVIRCQLCRSTAHRTWQCQRHHLPPEERSRNE